MRSVYECAVMSSRIFYFSAVLYCRQLNAENIRFLSNAGQMVATITGMDYFQSSYMVGIAEIALSLKDNVDLGCGKTNFLILMVDQDFFELGSKGQVINQTHAYND